MALKDIRHWSDDRKVSRLGEIGKILAKVPLPEKGYPEEVAGVLDEGVVIMLEILRAVRLEEGWDEITGFELFEAVWGGVFDESQYEWFIIRFRETRDLVMRFKEGSVEEKRRIRSKLMSRGMI